MAGPAINAPKSTLKWPKGSGFFTILGDVQ